MCKSILYTITNKSDNCDIPRLNDRTMTDKGLFVLISAAIYKKLKGKNPGPVDTQRLWDELVSNNHLKFDRTSIRNNIKDAFKSFLQGNIIIDFIALSEINLKLLNRELWNNLREEIKNDKTLISILSNITSDSIFAPVINEIKNDIDALLSSKKINNSPKIMTIDEYIKLEEMLEIDFKLLKEFIDFCGFKYNDKNDVTNIKSIFEESDIVIQQNFKISDLLNEYFINMSLYNSSVNESFCISSNTDLNAIIEFLNKGKSNLFNYNIIIGESGSGKSILGLKLLTLAIEKGFYVKFVSLDRYTDNFNLSQLNAEFKESFKNNINEKYFIFLDGLENLSHNKVKKSFTDLLFNIGENPDNIVIISSKDNSQEPGSLLNSTQIIRQIQKLIINPIDNPEKIWIKTPLDKIIYNQIKGKAKNRGALYYNYIDKVISSFSIKYNDNYSLNNIKRDFQKIAFYSLTKNIKYDELRKYGFNSYIETILRDNKLIKIDENNFGTLIFNNKIFRDFLTAGYLISLSEDEIKKVLLNNNFEDYKWRYVMLFISEWFTDNMYNLYTPILVSILYHLRQQKEFDKVDHIISFIPNSESELREKQNYYLWFEKSTSSYYKGQYYEALKYALKCLTHIKTHENDKPKLYNIIASCCNDLYLPDIALKVNDIGLIYSDERQKTRLMGNKARGYLRLNDFINSEKYFEYKKQLNHEIMPHEFLRDETDLLLLKSIKYKYQKEEKIIDYILSKAVYILERYCQKELENDIDDSGNKIYIFRNLSYLLTEIIDTKYENHFIEFINKITNLSKRDSGAYGIYLLNLSKYYCKAGNKDKAYTNLLEALQNFEAGNYKVEIYETLLNLYVLTKDKYYYEKALSYYIDIEKEAFMVINEIKENSLILDLFGIDIDYNSFTLPKPIEDNISILVENLVSF